MRLWEYSHGSTFPTRFRRERGLTFSFSSIHLPALRQGHPLAPAMPAELWAREDDSLYEKTPHWLCLCPCLCQCPSISHTQCLWQPFLVPARCEIPRTVWQQRLLNFPRRELCEKTAVESRTGRHGKRAGSGSRQAIKSSATAEILRSTRRLSAKA